MFKNISESKLTSVIALISALLKLFAIQGLVNPEAAEYFVANESLWILGASGVVDLIALLFAKDPHK